MELCADHEAGYAICICTGCPYFPDKVGRVIGFTRNATSKGAEGLKANGAEIETRTPSVETFRGVDVFINALSTDADPKVWDDYVKAAVDAGVGVYFPSEYGLYVLISFLYRSVS